MDDYIIKEVGKNWILESVTLFGFVKGIMELCERGLEVNMDTLQTMGVMYTVTTIGNKPCKQIADDWKREIKITKSAETKAKTAVFDIKMERTDLKGDLAESLKSVEYLGGENDGLKETIIEMEKKLKALEKKPAPKPKVAAKKAAKKGSKKK